MSVYSKLFLVFVLGLIIWTIVYFGTEGEENSNGLLIKLGESGATIALITVVGALVQLILKDREDEKQQKIKEQEEAKQKNQRDLEKIREKEVEKITFYKNILTDFKSVYDRVEKARLLIEAHRTAKTYGEQMQELIGGVVILHNIKRALNPGFPKLAEKLRPCIDSMNLFIKDLLHEYRNNYKRISVLQSIDETKKELLKKQKAESKNPEIRTEEIPAAAWLQIKELEKLTILRDDKRFEEYKMNFLVHLDKASEILRMRIPIEEEKEEE